MALVRARRRPLARRPPPERNWAGPARALWRRDNSRSASSARTDEHPPAEGRSLPERRAWPTEEHVATPFWAFYFRPEVGWAARKLMPLIFQASKACEGGGGRGGDRAKRKRLCDDDRSGSWRNFKLNLALAGTRYLAKVAAWQPRLRLCAGLAAL